MPLPPRRWLEDGSGNTAQHRCRQHRCKRRRYIFADLLQKKSISVHQIEHFSPVLARQLIALA
tara:strand:- start:37 stop:225 length:189 start_codon:yes stop_codon:yes gene_type:complete